MRDSDLRPFAVFAIFRAGVCIVDSVKKAALQKLLFNSVVSTEPGEKLDEKLASMTLTDYPDDCELCSRVVSQKKKI